MRRLKRTTTLAALGAALVFIGLAAPHASAGTVTYLYTGNPFTDGNLTQLVGDSLNLSVTFDAPLAPNLSRADLSHNIVSYQIADTLGYFNLSSLTPSPTIYGGFPTLLAAIFTTDGSGNITDCGRACDIFVISYEGFQVTANPSSPADLCPFPGITCPSTGNDATNELVISDYANFRDPLTPANDFYEGLACSVDNGRNCSLNEGSEGSLTSGSWTQTQTPEPSTITLSLAGLGSVALIFRRRLIHRLWYELRRDGELVAILALNWDVRPELSRPVSKVRYPVQNS